jgi:hypothetical protein
MRPLAFSGLLLAALIMSCGGSGSENKISLDKLADIASNAVPSGNSLDGRIIEDKEQLWEAVRDADLDEEWEGGYRARYLPNPEGIDRVELSIDLYSSISAASERTDAELGLNDSFLKKSLSPAVTVEEVDSDSASCRSLSITLSAIIPQAVTYCRSETAVVVVRAIGREVTQAIDASKALAERVAAAIDTEIAESS